MEDCVRCRSAVRDAHASVLVALTMLYISTLKKNLCSANTLIYHKKNIHPHQRWHRSSTPHWKPSFCLCSWFMLFSFSTFGFPEQKFPLLISPLLVICLSSSRKCTKNSRALLDELLIQPFIYINRRKYHSHTLFIIHFRSICQLFTQLNIHLLSLKCQKCVKCCALSHQQAKNQKVSESGSHCCLKNDPNKVAN